MELIYLKILYNLCTSSADRVYVSLGTAGTYPGYGPAVPRETYQHKFPQNIRNNGFPVLSTY